MSKRGSVHVVPRNDGWVIRMEGSSRATAVHKTQRAAVEAARVIARNQNTDLVIHGRDGRVRDWDSYEPEPLPPRNREVLFPDLAASSSDKAIKDAVTEVVRKSKGSSKNDSRSTSKG